MDYRTTLAYVQAAAALQALPLDDARAQRVAMHLARTAALAGHLSTFPLAVDAEPAEVYCPAAFPPDDRGGVAI